MAELKVELLRPRTLLPGAMIVGMSSKQAGWSRYGTFGRWWLGGSLAAGSCDNHYIAAVPSTWDDMHCGKLPVAGVQEDVGG